MQDRGGGHGRRGRREAGVGGGGQSIRRVPGC